MQQFLPSVLKHTQLSDEEIVVADNGSTDESLDYLRTQPVRVIALDQNYGFAEGYNRAIAQVDAEYTVLLNSDVEVTPHWLNTILEYMDAHPEVLAAQPKVLSWHSKQLFDKGEVDAIRFEHAGAAGGMIDILGYPYCKGRLMTHIEEDHGQYDNPTPIFWATGACLMVRSSVYRKLGGLDERFFAHMEEIDLCWRLKNAGYKIMYCPDSKIYHIGGGTLPKSSARKTYLNFRNNLMMLENNLAKTFALMCCRNEADIPKAARKGRRKARRRIATRKMLDMAAAIAYLITFRTECFKSVLKAHKDAEAMIRRPSDDDIRRYLMSGIGKVEGMYSRWIVLRSILKGRRIFSSIRDKDFYKI